MQVTLKAKNDVDLTLFVSKHAHIAVSRVVKKSQYTNDKGEYPTWEEVSIADGLHNNGGWKIAEPYDVVVAKIAAAMQAQS
jgi:hypothetical protein